jgi:hypothetical protein
MILVREITEWEDGMDCNHTYIMNESMEKMFGYFKKNKSKDFQMFKNPIRIDTRHRKFKVIKRNLNFAGQINTNKTWEIKGSKDHVYTVEETENGMVCSCIGFKYHGKCKHIDGVVNERK